MLKLVCATSKTFYSDFLEEVHGYRRIFDTEAAARISGRHPDDFLIP
jgi:hypothetical protein